MANDTTQTDAELARVRLTLDLSRRLNEEVERLAAIKQTTKADILRFAVEFLSAAENARQAGMQVGAWKDDETGGRREREFVGL